MAEMNRFIPLNEIDVNDHVKAKNGLKYLSWSWAWAEMIKRYPESYYTVYKDDNKNLYHTDGKTCWVEASFTLVDGDYKREIIEYLPVMDYKNNSIPLEKVTSRDVTDTIQRCVTKSIARHGLGCYIYQGQDLPEESEETKKIRLENEQKIAGIKESITALGKELTSKLEDDQRKEFFNTNFVPIIGGFNHLACNDLAKLEELLARLTKIKESTSTTETTKKKTTKVA